MDINHEDDGKKGKFYVMLDGKQDAAMTYVYAGENFIIEHTEVHEVFKGQGVGHKLVEAAVNFARENNIKIKPLCPFVQVVFKKKEPLYADILY